MAAEGEDAVAIQAVTRGLWGISQGDGFFFRGNEPWRRGSLLPTLALAMPHRAR